jgi:hypothetical protein
MLIAGDNLRRLLGWQTPARAEQGQQEDLKGDVI